MWGCGGGTSEQVCGVVGVGPGGWWARCSLFALQKLQRVVPSVSGDGGRGRGVLVCAPDSMVLCDCELGVVTCTSHARHMHVTC